MSCAYGPEAVHDWQPLHGWCGRYRCSYCRVLAHREALQGVDVLTPYKCIRKGCTHGAVQRKPQLCQTHADEARR